MIQSFFSSTGIWFWWIIGMVLIGIEIFAPGAFFLWFGIAAFFVGLITMLVGVDSAIWTWQAQLMAFGVLALVFAYFGRSVMTKKGWDKSDKPHLNDREAQMVGRTAVVTQALSGGNGRARIGDSTWRVSGPDLPVGASVVVVSASNGALVVKATA